MKYEARSGMPASVRSERCNPPQPIFSITYKPLERLNLDPPTYLVGHRNAIRSLFPKQLTIIARCAIARLVRFLRPHQHGFSRGCAEGPRLF
jgi:hypothetical protein